MTKTTHKIAFLCRGSVRDGLGHVVRTKRIAGITKELFATKVIVIGDESAENLLLNENLDYTITPHDNHALSHIKHFAPNVVVFDMMQFDEKDFLAISQSCKTVSLSPIFNCLALVDLIFHRTSIRGPNWQLGNDGPLIRAGLDYAIISERCRKINETEYRTTLGHETLAVAISMGGSDAANKTLAILNKVKDVPDRILFWALLGEGYAHSYEELVKCVRGSKHEIILAKTNDSMWRILNNCAFVILAGGTTTYESAFVGLPSVNTLETEEHYFLIQELVENGACTYAGYTFQESLQALRGIITRLNRNRQDLFKMHQNASSMIDAYGAQRVAKEIMELCDQTVN
jgi:spore coat polysaccharide biosynthesis predicted glycosyltransferase SpsG